MERSVLTHLIHLCEIGFCIFIFSHLFMINLLVESEHIFLDRNRVSFLLI